MTIARPRNDLNLCFSIGLLGAASALFTARALAADIRIEAPIDNVKVYQQGATVGRKAQVSIPAGQHRLVFTGLPANLDTDTLRIAVANTGMRLGAVEFEQVTDKEFVSAQERDLRKQLEALGDRKGVLQDDVATAETQLKLLDSLASAPAGGAAKPAVDGANLATVLGAMSTASTTARGRIREAKQQLRELDKEAARLNADLQKIATARKSSYEVRATIEASTAAQPTVAIEYSIDNAEWHWVYEARLDTQARRVTLSRQAAVSQGSGESWSNATLTLTTAQPEEDAATPQLASLFVALEPEQQAFADELRRSAAPVVNSALQEIIVTGTRRPRAALTSTDYLAEYNIPGRVTLEADQEPRLYPVAEEEVAVELVARVLPALSRSAHLEASFTYEGQVPMQGGTLQLYRDGAFVGRAALESLLPGAQTRLPFGTDERIRVAVRDEAKGSGASGLLSRQHTEEHRQRFEITSFHSRAIALEVLDRIPVSEDKDVRIEVLKGATAAQAKDLDGRAGLQLWKMNAQPRETVSIRHYYAVRYPAERKLAMREEDE